VGHYIFQPEVLCRARLSIMGMEMCGTEGRIVHFAAFL